MKVEVRKLKLLFVAFTCSIIFSCNNDANKTNENSSTTENKKEISKIATPDFNADSAFLFVAKQVKFGPRVPGTEAHKKCADYIISTLKNFGVEVTTQKGETKTFDGKTYQLTNIIGAVNPEKTNRIFLSAHWDTRPFSDQDKLQKELPIDGANDGGSGVAVLLEVARSLSKIKPNVGVDLIFWDIEDYGQPENSKFPDMENSYCLGSQYWCKNKSQSYYPKYGINLDMVGAPNAVFTMEGVSMQFASSVVQKVWETASRIGYSGNFSFEKTGSLTDDHAYVNYMAQIPCIDIIHHDASTPSNFPTTWHTLNDNIKNIDKASLKAVGQTLLEVICTEN